MEGKTIVALGAVGLLAYWLIKKAKPVAAQEILLPDYSESADPNYMTLDTEFPETYYSSDDVDGTAFYQLDTRLPLSGLSRGGPLRPVGQTRRMSDQGYANYPTFTGGTFIEPGYLPPPRQAFIQKISDGRLVNPQYLPPMRQYHLQ